MQSEPGCETFVHGSHGSDIVLADETELFFGQTHPGGS